MSNKDIQAGTYTGKPYSARFIESAKQTPGIEVTFRLNCDGRQEMLAWTGWLTQEAIENTMKTLGGVLGFNGDKTMDENGFLIGKNCIAWDREVNLVVERETNPNNGKDYARIKFVNTIGSGQLFKNMTAMSAKEMLNKTGFDAAFLAFKKENPGAAGLPAGEEPPF